jgi:hypothetical protein
MSAAEREELRRAAEANGRTVSQEIRWRCFGPPAKPSKKKS